MINKKELNCKYKFDYTLHTLREFYAISNWLNKYVGIGKDKWTTNNNKIVRTLGGSFPYNKGLSIGLTIQFYIFIEDFNDDGLAMLILSCKD